MLRLVPLGAACLATFLALDLGFAYGSLGTPPFGVGCLFVFTTSVKAFLATGFWLAVPAIAVDGEGFLAALGRSWRLAHGSRLRILALLVLLLFPYWAGLALLEFVAGDAWLSYAALSLLLLTLKACLLAAAYREICLAKEGPRAHELTAVFR
jgi:hypothetical protein